MIEIRKRHGLKSIDIRKDKMVMDKIRSVINDIGLEEKQLLKERNQHFRQIYRRFMASFFLGSVLSLLIIILVFSLLNYEISKRIAAEEKLNKSHDLLEVRIKERTTELENQIVEKQNIQGQLLQSNKMEAVGRLAGGIAHDFNNILTVILGNCTLLIEDLKDDNPAKEELEEIRKSSNARHL